MNSQITGVSLAGKVDRSVRKALSTLAVFGLSLVLFGGAALGQASPDRPIKGTLSGTTISTLAVTDPALVAQFCEPGTTALAQSEASGKLSHLGHTTTVDFSHCFVEVQPPVITADGLILADIVDGQVTFVAANGDSLGGTYSGTAIFLFEDQSLRVLATLTLTGGTGRFSDASGTLDMNVLILEGGLEATVFIELDGRISY